MELLHTFASYQPSVPQRKKPTLTRSGFYVATSNRNTQRTTKRQEKLEPEAVDAVETPVVAVPREVLAKPRAVKVDRHKACVILPPRSVWGQFIDIKHHLQPSASTSFPHIKLASPFVAAPHRNTVVDRFADEWCNLGPVSVSISTLSLRPTANGGVLWTKINNDDPSSATVAQLRSCLLRALPQERQFTSEQSFKFGVVGGDAQTTAQKLAGLWQPLEFQVNHVFVIERENRDVDWKVCDVIPLAPKSGQPPLYRVGETLSSHHTPTTIDSDEEHESRVSWWAVAEGKWVGVVQGSWWDIRSAVSQCPSNYKSFETESSAKEWLSRQQHKVHTSRPLKDKDIKALKRELFVAGSAVTTALCVIPPENLWHSVQPIRKEFDSAFERWMPHVNIAFPFVSPEQLEAAASLLRHALRGVAPFQLNLNHVDCFKRRNDVTVHLSGSNTVPSRAWSAVVEQVQACVPSVSPDVGGFKPHLTLGQFSSMKAAQQKLANREPKLSWTVRHLAVIARQGNTPFVVRDLIPLASDE